MQKLERAELLPITEQQVRDIVSIFPELTHDQARKQLEETTATDVVFINDVYQVNVRGIDSPGGPMWHLSIKRRDKERVGPERYRDFMAIKDQLIGPNFEAVEIYPPRNHEVDTANQYHLWVLPLDMVLPFGFHEGRRVSGVSTSTTKQQPLEVTIDQVKQAHEDQSISASGEASRLLR